jgi:hypothetical protein
MQDQKIEKIAAFAVNITKVLVIIYLGFAEVFKIGKLLIENLNSELDISRKWASQNYSILKKTTGRRQSSGCYRKLVSVIFTQQF